MDNLSKQLNNINSIVDLIGDTPLIKLNGFNGLSSDKQIFIKAEWFNPGGSIKDRAALSMIKDGINKKKLNSKKFVNLLMKFEMRHKHSMEKKQKIMCKAKLKIYYWSTY